MNKKKKIIVVIIIITLLLCCIPIKYKLPTSSAVAFVVFPFTPNTT